MKNFAVIAVLFVLLSGTVFAQKVNFATSTIAPWGLADSNSGIYVDSLKAIATDLGLDPTVSLFPMSRVLQSLTTGETDVSLMFGKTIPPETGSEVITIFNKITVVVIGKKGTAPKTIADLEGKRVGVLRGVLVPVVLNDNAKITKEVIDSYKIMLTMLDAGRIDYVLGATPALSYTLVKVLNLKLDILGSPLVLSEESAVLVVSAKTKSVDATMITKIKASVTKLSKAGTFDKIMNQYTR